MITGEHVRVVGKLELLDRLLIAPLSDRTCAYFQVEVELKKGGGQSGPYWSTIINKEKFVPFWLTDLAIRCETPWHVEVVMPPPVGMLRFDPGLRPLGRRGQNAGPRRHARWRAVFRFGPWLRRMRRGDGR